MVLNSLIRRASGQWGTLFAAIDKKTLMINWLMMINKKEEITSKKNSMNSGNKKGDFMELFKPMDPSWSSLIKVYEDLNKEDMSPRFLDSNFQRYNVFLQLILEKMRSFKKNNYNLLQELNENRKIQKSTSPCSPELDARILELTRFSYLLLENLGKLLTFKQSYETKVVEKLRPMCCTFILAGWEHLSRKEKTGLLKLLSKANEPSVKYYHLFIKELIKELENLTLPEVESILIGLTPTAFGFLRNLDKKHTVLNNKPISISKKFEMNAIRLFSNYARKLTPVSSPFVLAKILTNIKTLK